MHAVVVHEFGGPDVLIAGEHPEPPPRDGWVTVRLRAAAVNPYDCRVRRGHFDVPLPRVLGSDGAGVRRDTGEEVIVVPALHWGDEERAPGPDLELLGTSTDGTYAELVAVPEANVAPRPRGWSWTEAAALPLAGLTAYRALFARGGLRAGETVLVLGASGGVATIAIGLARIAGARVLVTTSSSGKLALARELGAEAGALYTESGWPEEIRALAGRGVDLVLDSVGSTWADALATLRPGGRIVAFGATGAATVEVDVRRLYVGQHSIVGTAAGSPRDFAALLELLREAPSWRPVVDRVLPLDQAAEAHRVLEAGEHVGKVVLSTG
jgi:zinc-binding alcohol dehydrogenase/oxidoreductase